MDQVLLDALDQVARRDWPVFKHGGSSHDQKTHGRKGSAQVGPGAWAAALNDTEYLDRVGPRTAASDLDDMFYGQPGWDRFKRAVDGWTRGGQLDQREIARADRTGVESDSDKAPGMRLLARAVAEAPANAPELHRTLTLRDVDPSEVPAMFARGSEFSTELGSFTRDEHFADRWGDASQGAVVTLRVREGAQALNIEPLSAIPEQKEWISGGTFRVVGNEFDLANGVIEVVQVAGPDQQVRKEAGLVLDLTKHLGSKHDQKTHGRGGGAGPAGPAIDPASHGLAPYSGSTDAYDILENPLAAAATAVIDGDLSAAPSDKAVRAQVKAEIQRELVHGEGGMLERVRSDPQAMAAVEECLVLLGKGSEPVEGFGNLAGPRSHRDRMIATYMHQGNGTDADVAARRAAASQMDDDELFLSMFAGTMVHSWAGSASDSNHYSMMLQRRVAERFGVGKEGFRAALADSTLGRFADSARHFNEDYARMSPLLDAYIDTTYSQTQARLKDAGVTHVVLSRGMSWPNARKAPAELRPDDLRFPADKQVEFRLNPLSSWSADPVVAGDFAGDEYTAGTVITSVVPVERVFSTARSGAGCLTEYEYILFDGPSQGTAMYGGTWEEEAYYWDGSEEGGS